MSFWNSAGDLISLREAMSRLLEDSFVPSRQEYAAPARPGLRLPVDVYTTDEEIVVQASLPGLRPDDVEITLEDDRLTLRGEMPAPLENVNYVLQERRCGCAFERTLLLNVNVDAERAEAHFDNGVLTLVIPKAEAAKPKVIKVKME